jgi:phosphate ABC transporter phosphate-binding protein
MTSTTSTGNAEGKTVIVRTEAGAARGRLLRRARIAAASVCGTVFVACAALAMAPSATAVPTAVKLPASGLYSTIAGQGSTWAETAINNWDADVKQNQVTVDYAGTGSTAGRQAFSAGTVQFGASEIPYGVADMNGAPDQAPARGYAYMPDVAGGTVLMYNLKIGTQRVTNLRLSGKTVADIFTGATRYWDDSEIKADNPDLNLPHIQIIPVVRSDGAGSTADFTQWILATDPSAWHRYCTDLNVGQNDCIQTSAYPLWQGDPQMVAQAQDTGVSGYVSQNGSDGAIGYTQYSYAIATGFPVAKLLNAAGYYTEPTPGHVAVSLLKAQINLVKGSPNYLTQNLSGVYSDTDPRTYELSAYSYLILPTDTSYNLTPKQGRTLGAYGSYLLCQGQQQVDNLGYSALPINLVEAGYAQLGRIPGAVIPATSTSFIQGCSNPTFDPNNTLSNNKLAETDPQPASCDKIGSVQCATPTGGAPGGGGAGGKTGSTNPSSGGNGTNPSSGSNGANPSSGSNGANPSSGSNGANPSSGSNGTNPSGSNGTNNTGTNAPVTVNASPSCDPNTGVCSTAGTGTDGTGNGGTAAQAGNPVPITLSSSNDDGVQVMLMAVCGALLLGLCVIPPLAAQASGRRRQQRLAKWSGMADDDQRPGGQR